MVLLVVSDFQCPVCRRAAEPMEDILHNFEKDLVIYFIQNPLKMHKNAMIAAQASMAAHKQGKFWSYHDTLFANQARLSHGHLEQHARDAKIFSHSHLDFSLLDHHGYLVFGLPNHQDNLQTNRLKIQQKCLKYRKMHKI